MLNLKTEEGLEIFWELLQTADVVIHNFRLGVAERLGIDYESVKKRKPEVVYLSFTAYNGPKPGPWEKWTAFDPVLQAVTGIMTRFGGKGNKPILHGWASCVDYIAGFSAALGLALGLYKRKRSRGGDLVYASLAQAAQLVQAPFMVSTETHRSGDEPQGQEARGEHSLYRLYEAGLGCHRVDCIEDIRRTYLHRMTSDDLNQSWDDGRSISAIRMLDHPAGSPVDTVAPAYARFKSRSLRLDGPNLAISQVEV